MRRLSWFSLVSLGCLGLCACVGSSDPESVVVALVDGRPQSLADLERYLGSNMIAGSEPGRAAERNAVKSRLFDAFLEERLLLIEAERMGVIVSDREVEAWIGVAQTEDEMAITGSRWDEVRRRLMIHKLQERIVLEEPPIPEPTVQRWAVEHRAELTPPRRLTIRTLSVETMAEAERIRREMQRGRLTFEEAIVSYGSFRGQGLPVEVTWEGLLEEQRRVLEGLEAGDISEPVTMQREIYLFQVDAWLHDPEQVELQVFDAARRRLENRRRERLFRSLLADLKQNTEVRMNPHKLPFDYIPEEDG